MVTDCDSAPYRTFISTQIVGEYKYTQYYCYRFRDRLTNPILYQVACQQLVS